ncbi:MAG: N-acetyl-gamma-glutamyl-phosphate reductase [Acidimicrobiia bacterium]|nr:N-acetyl-gamma-glutamyl-phosphate reductase [Acidimicrobiia bacterium]
MLSTVIVGASGYAGGELVRLVDGHPSMEVAGLVGHASAGKRLSEVHPQLSGGDRLLVEFDADACADADLVFLALPHGASTQPALELLGRGSKIVDLGSDFRLDTPGRYAAAYGADHPAPDQLGTWAYGIPELFATDIATSDRVAAPGCYPTSAVLALGPLVADSVVSAEGLIVDSMSGVSGAGRSLAEGLLFGTVDESVKAYKVLEHRHQPEMERALEAVGGQPATVTFTPHLVPMQRGILSTIYATPTDGTTLADLEESLDKAYAGSPFVSRLDTPPETRWVVGSNNAHISIHLDADRGVLILMSAIDNLLKGAAGQAVQCANLMFGLDETAGLPREGWMP